MADSITLELKSGYATPRYDGLKRFRYATLAECKALRSGQTVTFLAADNTAREAKVNGMPKTWTSRPQNVEIPLKYGLYEYGKAYITDLTYHGDTILIPL